MKGWIPWCCRLACGPTRNKMHGKLTNVLLMRVSGGAHRWAAALSSMNNSLGHVGSAGGRRIQGTGTTSDERRMLHRSAVGWFKNTPPNAWSACAMDSFAIASPATLLLQLRLGRAMMPSPLRCAFADDTLHVPLATSSAIFASFGDTLTLFSSCCCISNMLPCRHDLG